jgi:uncharacterized membrane protein YccF (DUF307 family)
MSPIALLLNLLWLLFGGLWAAIGWGVAAVIMAITTIGIPWAKAAFNMGVYTLLPFGFKAVSRDEHLGRGDIGTGLLGTIGNVVWLVLAGWWLALIHIVFAINAMTDISLHFRMDAATINGRLVTAGILSLWMTGCAIHRSMDPTPSSHFIGEPGCPLMVAAGNGSQPCAHDPPLPS